MKKAVYSVITVILCVALFSGCSKNTPQITAINPSMTAEVGVYNFTAATTVPSTLDTQYQQPVNPDMDTVHNLLITGHSSDLIFTKDKIVLNLTHYDGLTGTFSIVQGQANAAYYHNNVLSVAIGGIVSITHITSNSIIGYFSFTTSDGISVTNGAFTVGLPNGKPF